MASWRAGFLVNSSIALGRNTSEQQRPGPQPMSRPLPQLGCIAAPVTAVACGAPVVCLPGTVVPNLQRGNRLRDARVRVQGPRAKG